MKYYEDTIKELSYSNPEDGENPVLTRFENLNEPAGDDYDELPIRDSYPVSRTYRVLRLPRTESGTILLHFYNASSVGLQLRYYGLSGNSEVEPLKGYDEVRPALASVALALDDGFDAYLVRIGIGLKGEEREFTDQDYISVAAYDGDGPQSPGSISVAAPEGDKGETVELPFSHNGRSFQRLVISTCDPEEDIRPLLKELNMEDVEVYFGKFGSVAAIGVPPGMSLDTGGDLTRNIRQKGHYGGDTVSEDVILNMFSADQPTLTDPDASADFQRKLAEEVETALSELEAPAFEAPGDGQFNSEKDPLTVAIIDSGIDYHKSNAHHWVATRYEEGATTEYLTPGAYGYDFIRRNNEPRDETPHGTYVAATILNQYRADRPLQLLHMKTFGKEAIASYFGALVSIYEAIAAGVKVINLSWGFYDQKPPEALYCAIKIATGQGVFIVTSAGNDRTDLDSKPQWPAAFADDFPCNLLTVASFKYDWTKSSIPDSTTVVRTHFTNYGQREVPVAAFLTSPVFEYQSGDPYQPGGTSISTPIVTGLLADWLARHPRGTLAEFRHTYFIEANALKPDIGRGHYLPHSASPGY